MPPANMSDQGSYGDIIKDFSAERQNGPICVEVEMTVKMLHNIYGILLYVRALPSALQPLSSLNLTNLSSYPHHLKDEETKS